MLVSQKNMRKKLQIVDKIEANLDPKKKKISQ